MNHRPPFQITSTVLNLCAEISELIGRLAGSSHGAPQIRLRRKNRIRTVHASLAIEGNTLGLEQVSAILENKQVVGPKADILEVRNAIEAYDGLLTFKPHSIRSILLAHKIIMRGLVADAGRWRTGNVGIIKGRKVAHVAPKAALVPQLMDDLMDFIKGEESLHYLIKGAVFHYELEFIHPFSDGNGRVGRLWQTVILSHHEPIFQYVPVESVIKNQQKDYYGALSASDKAGHCTPFIEFNLNAILLALRSFHGDMRFEPNSPQSRLEQAQRHFGKRDFQRKDYMQLFKSISTATASRDLANALAQGLVARTGDKATAQYKFT